MAAGAEVAVAGAAAEAAIAVVALVDGAVAAREGAAPVGAGDGAKSGRLVMPLLFAARKQGTPVGDRVCKEKLNFTWMETLDLWTSNLLLT